MRAYLFSRTLIVNSLALHDAVHQVAAGCPNCGASVEGNYCQQCGQETALHPPSAREFLHEFVGHYVALEGKLWRSLALLLCRPGRLTREYVEGRRVRYVQPLRVYLTFSIIFFALFNFGDISVGRSDTADPAPAVGAVRPGAQPAQRAGRADAERGAGDQAGNAADTAPAAARHKNSLVTLADEPQVRAWFSAINPALGAKVGRFFDAPKEEMSRQLSRGFYSYAPYALFLLMPVFAFWLKLLYLGSGRRYGEHLLFALHTNAFAFAALSLLLLTPGLLWPIGVGIVLWMIAYLPLAMRRVYGGRRTVTVARWVVLMLLHLAGFLLAIATATALAVLMG